MRSYVAGGFDKPESVPNLLVAIKCAIEMGLRSRTGPGHGWIVLDLFCCFGAGSLGFSGATGKARESSSWYECVPVGEAKAWVKH